MSAGRLHAWLDQAAAAAGCDCSCCRRWRQVVADHLDAPVRRELDRHAAAELARLTRENERLTAQVDALRRRRKGAA